MRQIVAPVRWFDEEQAILDDGYDEFLEVGPGMVLSGLSMDGNLVEMIELPDHPWFVACQFHPEFTATPRDGHPLFAGFVRAALHRQQALESGATGEAE